MTLATMLIIAIPNIVIGFIQLFLFVKTYRTTKAMHEMTAEYLKQVAETCIDVIKKTREDHR